MVLVAMSLPAIQISAAWRSMRLAATRIPISSTATTTITTAAIASVSHHSVTTSVGMAQPPNRSEVPGICAAVAHAVVCDVDQFVDEGRRLGSAPATADDTRRIPARLAIGVALGDAAERSDERTHQLRSSPGHKRAWRRFVKGCESVREPWHRATDARTADVHAAADVIDRPA